MPPNLTFLSSPSPCEYLPDRMSQLRYEVDAAIQPADYMHRLRAGWRRFGPVLFQPACGECQECRSLRVPVESFHPTESQRRAWKRNLAEVTLTIDAPSINARKLQLFADFHRHGRDTKGWPSSAPSLDLFVFNSFPTEEWSYHVGDRLVAVGYVDALPEGLSAIYFYWDPSEQRRSLGTFNIVQMIQVAKQRKLPHVYLGYYVDQCRSLEYKARFRPNELRDPAGRWIPYETGRPTAAASTSSARSDRSSSRRIDCP